MSDLIAFVILALILGFIVGTVFLFGRMTSARKLTELPATARIPEKPTFAHVFGVTQTTNGEISAVFSSVHIFTAICLLFPLFLLAHDFQALNISEQPDMSPVQFAGYAVSNIATILAAVFSNLALFLIIPAILYLMAFCLFNRALLAMLLGEVLWVKADLKRTRILFAGVLWICFVIAAGAVTLIIPGYTTPSLDSLWQYWWNFFGFIVFPATVYLGWLAPRITGVTESVDWRKMWGNNHFYMTTRGGGALGLTTILLVAVLPLVEASEKLRPAVGMDLVSILGTAYVMMACLAGIIALSSAGFLLQLFGKK